ncbi:MAG: hypothetical protein QOE33_244 [Acidobacteriota bacterium]|nr:hypothetical protein [Acidobacteriota bacterium]
MLDLQLTAETQRSRREELVFSARSLRLCGVRTDLGFHSGLEYFILGGGVGRWDFGADNAYADTSVALASAFNKNPYMKLFVGCGYYDLATPHFAARYTLEHMGLDPSLRGNVCSTTTKRAT